MQKDSRSSSGEALLTSATDPVDVIIRWYMLTVCGDPYSDVDALMLSRCSGEQKAEPPLLNSIGDVPGVRSAASVGLLAKQYTAEAG